MSRTTKEPLTPEHAKEVNDFADRYRKLLDQNEGKDPRELIDLIPTEQLKLAHIYFVNSEQFFKAHLALLDDIITKLEEKMIKISEDGI